MLRLRLAVIAGTVAALLGAPALAHATVTGSQITSWVSSTPATANSSYLISLDNPPSPTTLDVQGTATGINSVDVVCFYGSPTSFVKLASAVPVNLTSGTFDTGAVPLRPIAGHACRLRAIPTGTETTTGELDSLFAGPDVAVSEAALPAHAVGSGQNHGVPYNFYVNDVTFSGLAAWSAAGTPALTDGPYACGGPAVAPIDPSYDLGNFAIDCAGSLLSDDLGVWEGDPGGSSVRSEVQIDGNNAYDAASAQNLFAAGGGNPASQNLTGFPSVGIPSVDWDPSTGLISSQWTESWVACTGSSNPNAEPPSFATCPSFVNTGVQLQRDITTSDGGRVVTLTDTWSSTDGNPHTLDLLYDDYVGVAGNEDSERGFEFPGQSGFSQYTSGQSVPGPTTTPNSILVHTNVGAPDGAANEAFGAITFDTAPSEYGFAPLQSGNSSVSSELEEHVPLSIPAGGSATLSYVYSVGYSQADVQSLALTAQDHFQAPALAITGPGNGAMVSTPSVTVTGTASSGSGVASLTVGGQSVPVGPGGAWSAQVPLNPGTNTITALATDGAGVAAQTEVTVVYEPPGTPASSSAPPAPKCKVPRIKNLKLSAAERAIRRAHCRVGRIVRKRSQSIRRGRVIGSTPRSGRHLAADWKVELFVSKGT